jgi:hypothetical protein
VEAVEEVQEVLPAEAEDELEVVEQAPAAKRRRPVPQYEDDEEQEDDRPRGRRGRPKKQPPGPWLLALALAPACGLVGFLFCLLLRGTSGLPEDKDGGPVASLLGLSFVLLACCVVLPFGVFAVKNRHTFGKWGIEIQGTTAVWVGMVQSFFSGLLGGVAVYGLIFEVYHLLV